MDKVIYCKDCKYQKRVWREDKRMKENGYWVCSCKWIDDPFAGVPVWGQDNQFCSSAEEKDGKSE